MVSGLTRSKNLSKMKSPKANAKSRRNRYVVFKDQCNKSPTLEQTDCRVALNKAEFNLERKVKSGSWKRKPLRCNSPSAQSLERATPSTSKFRPGILYSDVVFRGDNANTLVKVRSLTPKQGGSHPHFNRMPSRGRNKAAKRKRISDVNNNSRCSGGTQLISLEKRETTASFPQNSTELVDFTKQLANGMTVEIPSWNYTDLGTTSDIPDFVCQFEDYNYLVCEKVALVGLRLASDGKFKC